MHPLYHLITLPIDYRNQIIYESTLKVVLPELSNNQDLQPIKCEIKSNEYYKCSDKEKWKKVRPAKFSVTKIRCAQSHVNQKRI